MGTQWRTLREAVAKGRAPREGAAFTVVANPPGALQRAVIASPEGKYLR
jgi:hypothetical protein